MSYTLYEWIPVNERLPEKGVIVLTFTPAAPYKFGHSTIDYVQQNQLFDSGYWMNSSRVAGDPTHWTNLDLPCPKPIGKNIL